MTYKLKIPGVPQGKGRPRFTRTGRTYTPRKTTAAEKTIQLSWLMATGGAHMPSGVPYISIEAVFVPPPSWPKKRRSEAMDRELPHVVKPDADNILKLVMDALRGLAYSDDSRVQIDSCYKIYGAENCTNICVRYDDENDE